ncbi:MAG TPA: ArsR family transcriptional regulator [Methanomicrobia archaeon]|nr:ArsR family transcriptional regulator [Methanomicrobia archaeon]
MSDGFELAKKEVQKQDPSSPDPSLNFNLLSVQRPRPALIGPGPFSFDIAEKKLKNKTPLFPHKTPKLNFNLSLLQQLSRGRRPAQIARELGISKPALQYHLNQLKAAGLISKLGYGCWEVNDTAPINPQKRSTKTTQVTLDKTHKLKFSEMPDSVRGHAFVFVLKVPPGLLNWNNRRREEYLKRHGIAYQPLRIAGGGQRIWVGGRKVWLTTSSIVIYEKSSFFAATAKDAKHHALFSFIAVVKKLERTLHADFTFKLGKEYRFKVSRQHYALVQNALAEQYDHEGKRLQVREPDAGKLWFVIDNSFNLHEAETVHPRTADSDNAKVQNFFNSLKACPVTTDVLVTAIAGVTQNQVLFAENITNHIQAVRELGQGVREMNQLLAKLEVTQRDARASQAERMQTREVKKKKW